MTVLAQGLIFVGAVLLVFVGDRLSVAYLKKHPLPPPPPSPPARPRIRPRFDDTKTWMLIGYFVAALWGTGADLEILTGQKFFPWWLKDSTTCLASKTNCAAYDPPEGTDLMEAIRMRWKLANSEHNREMVWNEVIGMLALLPVASLWLLTYDLSREALGAAFLSLTTKFGGKSASKAP